MCLTSHPSTGIAVLCYEQRCRYMSDMGLQILCILCSFLQLQLVTIRQCFHSRLQVLLAAENKEQVANIMEDLSQLKVVPLLQGVLFGR